VFEALGYAVYMMYEKYRTTFRLDNLEVVLDELPYGNFVEIEGLTVKAFNRLPGKWGSIGMPVFWRVIPFYLKMLGCTWVLIFMTSV